VSRNVKSNADNISASDVDGAEQNSGAKETCGIIMPISAMPPKYDAAHWNDVKKVIHKAITDAGMYPQIVSDDFESDVIQRRIIKNLYENPVVVCDVSGLNPNVMFELGMRITFKKPVIIITDDIGSIPFDTRVIEHVSYPAGLHIHETNFFISTLTKKIINIHNNYINNKFRSFIEDFGTFETLEPKNEYVGIERIISDKFAELELSLRRGEVRNPLASARWASLDRRPDSQFEGPKIRIYINSYVPDDIYGSFINHLQTNGIVKKITVQTENTRGFSSVISIIYDSMVLDGERFLPIVLEAMPTVLRNAVSHSEIE